MVYVVNASSLNVGNIGAEYVIFNVTSKIGVAEMMMLISSFKKYS